MKKITKKRKCPECGREMVKRGMTDMEWIWQCPEIKHLKQSKDFPVIVVELEGKN